MIYEAISGRNGKRQKRSSKARKVHKRRLPQTMQQTGEKSMTSLPTSSICRRIYLTLYDWPPRNGDNSSKCASFAFCLATSSAAERRWRVSCISERVGRQHASGSNGVIRFVLRWLVSCVLVHVGHVSSRLAHNRLARRASARPSRRV